jgi:hypothetical protein
MRYAGLAWEGTTLKVALLSDTGVIERLESFSEVPLALLQEKNLHLVTGLAADLVVRREATLQLQRRSAILKALPFQLEAVLPFDEEEIVAHPIFHPAEDHTEVVVFATTRSAVQHHIDQLQSSGIDPDQVSCVPLAIARWARFLFPEHPLIRYVHEKTAIVLDGDKIVFSQNLEDLGRLEAYLQQKFPTYFSISEADTSLQNATLKEYAIPIGLALEGKAGCQFRQGELQSFKETRKKRLWRQGSLAVCLGLALVAGGIGTFILNRQEQALEKKIALHFTAPDAPLEEKIALWQQQLLQESKGFPLIPDVPTVSEVLAWLGSLQEPIDIVQFHYSLVKYPKAGEKEEPYTAN